MPGGVAAIREPWRMSVAWGLTRDDVIAAVPGPQTTSMGRLFDAVAAMLTGRTRVTYEAQAAVELEAMARTVPRREAPRYEAEFLDPSGLLATITREHRRGANAAVVAGGFHEAIG